MKLVPKGCNKYNPVVLLIGVFCLLGGGYMLVKMGFSGPLILWLVRGIPAALTGVGAIIVVTQFQAYKRGSPPENGKKGTA